MTQACWGNNNNQAALRVCIEHGKAQYKYHPLLLVIFLIVLTMQLYVLSNYV